MRNFGKLLYNLAILAIMILFWVVGEIILAIKERRRREL